nr:retrotransposon-related protein [Tanacetum cinerariifolium]
GGGDQCVLLSRSIWLDVPKFSRVDPESWIFFVKEYFSLLNTLTDQHLRIVGLNLEGAAAEWFRLMTRNGLITTCDRFKESVKNHSAPSKYEDPKGALSKLLQLGMVEDYQRQFKKLMNRVTDIPDSLLISFYISGLKLHLQRELLVSKPTTFGHVFSLARTIEAHFDDQAALMAGMSVRLEANKVVNNGDDLEFSGPLTPISDSESSGEVKLLNWVHQTIDVESTW